MGELMKKILIVDDADLNREVLKAIFEEQFDILEAENGIKAIEKLDVISEKYKVRFILSVSKDKENLPECAKAKVVVAL